MSKPAERVPGTLGPLKRWEIAAVVAILTTALATPVALYRYYQHWQAGHYRALIVSEVAVGDAVFIGGETYFREGCGTAVFALAPAAAGVGVVPGAGPADVRYPPSAGWMTTPYVLTGDGMTTQDTWLQGLDCAGMDEDLYRKINAALNRPGSFVKRRGEDAVIVMPALRLAALVYYG